MASINEFKILNAKCKTYFDILEKDLGRKVPVPTDKHKERFGFYLFMLESLCSIKDTLDLIELITDMEFNSSVFGKRDEDCGVDAVHIDEDSNYINLYNFKFRDKFSLNREQSFNDSFLSTKFVKAIITESVEGLTGKVRTFSDDIISKLNSTDVWKMRLYVISNEPKELDTNTSEIKQLKDLYDLELVPMGLSQISRIMSLRPSPINAVIHVDKDSILPFVESSLSSSKSYVIRISANDLLRITCDSEQHRGNYRMEDFSVLHETEMEYDLLFDNVRGFVARSKFNESISKTLKEEPTKFFMYNNGLTLTANDIIAEYTNAHKKVKITINDFQIVNGGQTLRTLHNFKQQDADNMEKYLSGCELLIRVFKTSTEANVRNKIAEFTNSQNAISSIDLKSLTSEQIQIEQFLDEHNIVYARKSGDTGISPTKKYIHKILGKSYLPYKVSRKRHQIRRSIFSKNIMIRFSIAQSSIYQNLLIMY